MERESPIAILTDFEEFYVIDCRLKPNIKDALDREIKSFHYNDYADEEKFKWIYWLFSHEAIAGGSIEKFVADKLSKPKGKAIRGGAKSQPVDEVFLAELDGYRENLAKAFKNSNQKLQSEELTEAVQRTIDRLVFIRFLEDKLIEDKEIATLIDRLMAWDLFTAYCKKLEPKYNGLIFKPHPVIDSEKFNAPDEKVFSGICEGLAGRESPYNFDQIPISILGSIYERFLGKVVRATPKGAKVEDKPEVRKAGGVYYTPDYIVRYIVKETVGKLIEGKTPEEISKMAFADIACGSGSFLIEVYDMLLKYHERYYAENPGKAKKGDTDQREGRKVLSLKKRQEILVNNIYGVDIDYQATEVTQLSLYLKLLEDVTTNEAYQFSLLKEKILPNLSRNIVNGNSLIGKDIAEGNLFPEVDESKLKPMNFEDVFPDVMGRGGFDAVVGNPPWVRMESHGLDAHYLKNRYEAFHSAADLYTYFIERAVSKLRTGGSFGYIVSNKWLRAEYGKPLRDWLKEENIERIVDFGHLQVFKGATTYPCILTIEKGRAQDYFEASVVQDLNFPSLGDYIEKKSFRVDKSSLGNQSWLLLSRAKTDLIARIQIQSTALGDYSHEKIYYGIKTALNEAFIIDSHAMDTFVKSEPNCKEILKPYLEGKDIGRYNNLHNDSYVILVPNGFTKERMKHGSDPWKWFTGRYRPIAKHLSNYETKARKRSDQGEFWWELRPCDYYPKFEVPKICWGNLSAEAPFTIDKSNCYINAPACIYPSDDLFVLGCINSRLLWWILTNISAERAGGFIEAKPIYVEQLPIRKINFSDSADKSGHDHIVKLVERMLAGKEELSGAKTEAETTRLERECESLDRQIDLAVYQLYGLTEEEIKVVEGK